MRTESLTALSPYGVTLRCGVCTIFIGQGHFEAVAFPSPSGAGAVCSACAAALERGAALGDDIGRRPPAGRFVLKPADRLA